jgi:hypothetical protein
VISHEEANMKRSVWMGWAATVVAAVGVVAMGVATAAGPDAQADDLAVVKRAVTGPKVAQAAPDTPAPRSATRDEPARALRAAGKEPTWLKVRVTEKGSNRKKVTVNLPLALVRAVGDGWPRIDFACGDERHARCEVRISEILAALEAGQDLVEIDDEDQMVRVWVE